MSKTGSNDSASVNCGGCLGCLLFIIVVWVLFFGGTLTIMGHVIKAHCC